MLCALKAPHLISQLPIKIVAGRHRIVKLAQQFANLGHRRTGLAGLQGSTLRNLLTRRGYQFLLGLLQHSVKSRRGMGFTDAPGGRGKMAGANREGAAQRTALRGKFILEFVPGRVGLALKHPVDLFKITDFHG